MRRSTAVGLVLTLMLACTVPVSAQPPMGGMNDSPMMKMTMLNSPDVKKDVALSEEQVKKIDALAEKATKLFQGPPQFDQEKMQENMKKLGELRPAFNEKYVAELTDEQKKIWTEKVGDPFKGTVAFNFGGQQFGEYYAKVTLLNNVDVRKDVFLTEEQGAKVDGLIEKQTQLFQGGGGGREKFQELQKEMEKFVKDDLKAEQTKRLDQISLQQQGGGAFRNQKIVDELKITDAQKAKFAELEAEWQRKSMTIFNPAWGELETDIEKFLKNDLKPEQIKRLDQIALQQQGVEAFRNQKLVKELKLTDEQKKKFRELSDEYQKAVGELRRSLFDPEKREEARKKMTELRVSATEKHVKELTEDQHQVWKEKTGEPFKGTINFGGPPRP